MRRPMVTRGLYRRVCSGWNQRAALLVLGVALLPAPVAAQGEDEEVGPPEAEGVQTLMANRVLECFEAEGFHVSDRIRQDIEAHPFVALAERLTDACDLESGNTIACEGYLNAVSCRALSSSLSPDASQSQPFASAVGAKILECYAEEGLMVDDAVRESVELFSTTLAVDLAMLGEATSSGVWDRARVLVADLDCAQFSPFLAGNSAEMIRRMSEGMEVTYVPDADADAEGSAEGPADGSGEAPTGEAVTETLMILQGYRLFEGVIETP